MITSKNSCCFTGHRPGKLPWGYDEGDPRCEELRNKLFDLAESTYHSGITHFICGMALGSDLLFCEEIIRLRNWYPKITLEAAIPCETQAIRWSEQDRFRYFKLVSECDFESLLQHKYTPDCMINRNKYMVNHSCVLLAVFDGSLGGTMQTIRYAKQKGLQIIQIRP